MTVITLVPKPGSLSCVTSIIGASVDR